MSIQSMIFRKIKLFEKDFDVYNHIYLSKSALLNNFDLLSKLSPSKQIIPVLKSNAYGHGLEQITTILKERRFPYIAVDGYFEAIKIREISKQPVLVMGSIKPENYSKIDTKNIAFVVHDIETIKFIGKTNKKFSVHIEIETGMHRHGVEIKDLPKIINLINKFSNISIDGIMTHLADADNPKDNSFTETQTQLFDEAVSIIAAHGIKPKYIHIAQSAGCTKVESKYANCIRVGLSLYGINPLSINDKKHDKLLGLKPVLKLSSCITKIVNISKNDTVGYNRTYNAVSSEKIGIIPLGYYEGLPREFGNEGYVKYKDNYLKIVGKICMNHFMINLKNISATVGNEIIIISDDINDKNSINKLSKTKKIFPYGLLAGLNQNIRRVIVK